MFCPSCGFEYTHKTNYCKRCGGDLAPAGVTDAPKKGHLSLVGMFWGVIAFSLSSVGIVLAAYDRLLNNARCNGLCKQDEVLLAFVATFLSVVTLLLFWQLARMVTAFRRTGQNLTVEKHFIREIPPAAGLPTGQIPPADFPRIVEPSSVVEHTTRSMSGAYAEPKSTR
jgi:hypothetical protein